MQEMSRRSLQVAQAIRNELVDIARRELNDPRIDRVGMITFAQVELSPDHREATVWVSFMGKAKDAEDVKEAIKALNSASGFIHRSIIKRIPMKVHPRFHFKYDESFDKAAKVNAALHEAAQVEEEAAKVKKQFPQSDE